METPEGKYVFHYESEMDEENHRWSFAFHFPLGRQEILHLTYHPHAQAGGIFYRKVISALGQKDRNDLNNFLRFVALLAEVRQFRKGVKKFSLSNDTHHYFLRMKEDPGEFPYIALSQLDEYYRKMTIQYDDQSKSNLKLLLFATSCAAAN
jgi:hypothetical protein